MIALAALLACAPRTPPPVAVPPPVAPIAPAAPPTAPLPTARAVSPVPVEGCAVDADCVATNFPGCCACPQCSVGRPRAIGRAALARETAACAVVECDMRPCDLGGMCPPGEDASHFDARCVGGSCVLERR